MTADGYRCMWQITAVATHLDPTLWGCSLHGRSWKHWICPDLWGPEREKNTVVYRQFLHQEKKIIFFSYDCFSLHHALSVLQSISKQQCTCSVIMSFLAKGSSVSRSLKLLVLMLSCSTAWEQTDTPNQPKISLCTNLRQWCLQK